MKLKLSNLAILALTIVFFASCKNEKAKEEPVVVEDVVEETVESLTAVANISEKNSSGVSGTVSFSEIDGIVSMEVNIEGLSEGIHAIHIHENGDCSSDDGKSAGGHWNPTTEDHGKWESSPFHKGDIGNLVVGSDGKGTMSSKTDLWCIGCDDASKDILGKGIIVHAGVDDFKSQPSGAAGSRIGCGVIVDE